MTLVPNEEPETEETAEQLGFRFFTELESLRSCVRPEILVGIADEPA